MPLTGHIVKAKQPWSGQIKKGQLLVIKDIQGQQAVDFLCYDASNTADRYSATNTIKVQGNIYVGKGTVLYSDSGKALMTVIEDTIGRHDTVYGCCSIPNNVLRYDVDSDESCYDNFLKELSRYKNGLGVDCSKYQLVYECAGSR